MSALPAEQNRTILTQKQLRAAELLADDELGDRDIAKSLGIGRTQLASWKHIPEFAAEIVRLRDLFRQQAMDRAVFADKRARVVALNGIATDLMAQLSKAEYQVVLKTTDDGEAVHGFDTFRVKEFRACLADIAEEMGDRKTTASASASVTVKVYTDPRMENPIEANWDDAPPARSSADA